MSISMGALVTLLIDKSHPNGNELSSGVSGMIVETNLNPDGSIRYIVDFGSEGQWNCTEEELSQEGIMHRETPDRPEPRLGYNRTPDQNISPISTLRIKKDNEYEKENILSFEEEMKLLEG